MKGNRKYLVLMVVLTFLVVNMFGCATNPNTLGGAIIGGTAGVIAGNIIDGPKAGMALGGLGAIIGGLFGLSEDIRVKAIKTGQTQTAREGEYTITSEPMPSQRTECHKVRTIIKKNGVIVEDETEEICEGYKITNTY